jgi:hypothetical protein
VRDDPAPSPVHGFALDNMLRNGPQTQDGTTIFANGMTAEPRKLFLKGFFVAAPSRTLDRSRRGNSFRLRVRNAATRRYLLPSPRVTALQVCDDTAMRT